MHFLNSITLPDNIRNMKICTTSRFFKACRDSNTRICKSYLEAGFEVNTRDGHGFSPLINAVLCRRKEIVQLLLDNGAQVDFLDARGNSPLMMSVTKGDKEMIQLLLTNGANIHLVNNRGESVLEMNPDQDIKDIIENWQW